MKPLPPEKVAAWIESNFPFKTRKGGAEYIICNPLTGDTGYHFNINPQKGTCHDWRGDDWAGYDAKTGKKYSRSVVRFASLYLNCGVADAIRAITGTDPSRYLIQRRLRGAEAEVMPPPAGMQLPAGSVRLLDSDQPTIARMLLRWLRSRGLDRELVARCDIHHLGSSVVWPYYEFDELVYWQSRSRLNKVFQFPGESEHGVGKGDFLYGFDFVELPADFVTVHEAVFDALTINVNSLATGGADLSQRQVAKLKFLRPQAVVLAPDNDDAGIKSLLRNGRLLQQHGFRTLYALPPKLPYVVEGESRITKDWNEIGQFLTGFGAPVQRLFDEVTEVLDRRAMIRLRLDK